VNNIFLPRMAIIKDIIEENSQIKTFITAFHDEQYNQAFTYKSGQFMMVSMPHHGEAPISISSTPSRTGHLHLSIRKAGSLTGAMFALKKGNIIGLRGPYGRPFPVEEFDGDLLFVAGGIGLAPLRSVINYSLDQGSGSGKKTILYGSRSPADIAFRADFETWRQHAEVTCLLTVDEADESWTGSVGVVTALLDQIAVDVGKSCALVCGPPIMIRYTLAKLAQMGFSDQNVWTTMERHMKCGQGTCGHCYLDGTMICMSGPVFNREELKALHPEELGA
jgi:NAD(P)H-flavin reductase